MVRQAGAQRLAATRAALCLAIKGLVVSFRRVVLCAFIQRPPSTVRLLDPRHGLDGKHHGRVSRIKVSGVSAHASLYLVEQADSGQSSRLSHAARVHVRKRVREKAGHVQAKHLCVATKTIHRARGGGGDRRRRQPNDEHTRTHARSSSSGGAPRRHERMPLASARRDHKVMKRPTSHSPATAAGVNEGG